MASHVTQQLVYLNARATSHEHHQFKHIPPPLSVLKTISESFLRSHTLEFQSVPRNISFS